MVSGTGLVPEDEGRHDVGLGVEARGGRGAGGGGPERWSFAAGEAGRLAAVHLTLVAPEGAAAFAAAVRLDPGYAVVLVADALPLPRRGLELRGPGIWADHNVEEPFERWSLGIEAFAVGVEIDPSDDLDVVLAVRGAADLRGDRVALGWDLEWIADGPVLADAEGAGTHGYRVPARVEGELVVGHDTRAVDDPGEWSHRW